MILASSIAGIAILALGGTFAINGIAGPQDGPAPGAELPAAPVAFSGGFRPGPCREVVDVAETVGAALQSRGPLCNPIAVGMTDDRLEGTVTWSKNADRYLVGGFEIAVSGLTIENDGGTWHQAPRLALDIGSTSQAGPYVFIGDGGYSGLIAIAQVESGGGEGDDLSGFIIEAELPPVPEHLLPAE